MSNEVANNSLGADMRGANESLEVGARVEADQRIVLVSSFTVDLLQHPLRFWMEALGIRASIDVAPYAQIMQELLNPESLLSRNGRGFNVVALRLEDWIRDRMNEEVDQNFQHIRESVSNFESALGVLRKRITSPILIFLCPPSSLLPASYRGVFEDVQRNLMTALTSIPNVFCWDHAHLMRLYPLDSYEDLVSDRVGHIPYTAEYFTTIATLISRQVAGILKPQRKVIVLDCDDTLWKGVCGEIGPAGIELTDAHLGFQKMLVGQHDAGMLLCLSSKNNESDVEEVFRARTEMPLRRDHLICSRLNWDAKSSNIESLSRELDLSLDSFVFIDDSPMECAEVRAHCPSVLTLQFPSSPREISHFINHTWVFDRIVVTEEARQRTLKYKQNQARNVAFNQTADLQQFLDTLGLVVVLSPMQGEQLARVAELVHRTNQFNLSGVRRRSSEIEAIWRSGELSILVVHVSDRFGDYGLVGAVMFGQSGSTMTIDTFVLSCRVLGRGVEHRVMNVLGTTALKGGMKDIALRYQQTGRNAPARDFLEKSFIRYRHSPSGGGRAVADCVFVVPADYAEGLEVKVGEQDTTRQIETNRATRNVARPAESVRWHETAYRFSHVDQLMEQLRASNNETSRRKPRVGVSRSPIAETIVRIWEEVLGLRDVRTTSDFFDLGGDSLLAVQVIARMSAELGFELSIYDFFESPTIAEMAKKLSIASRSEAAIERGPESCQLPLSFAQEGLWFLDRLGLVGAAYNVSMVIRLEGTLQVTALDQAFREVIRRQGSLRSRFESRNGRSVQIVDSAAVASASFEFTMHDLEESTGNDKELELKHLSFEEAQRPFDLACGPPLRAVLVKLGKKKHVVLLTLHHIVCDGWSLAILNQELGALYAFYVRGGVYPLQELSIQYADYAVWQRKWSQGDSFQEQLQYWRERLLGAPPQLDLPTDRPRPRVESYKGAALEFELPSPLLAQLKELTLQADGTLFMVLLAGFQALMARWSGQQDIVVGSPIAGRRKRELEGLIGLFVNTLAFRTEVAGRLTFRQLLARVREVTLGAYANQDLPFEELVKELRPQRSLSRQPIFQAMLVLQNYPQESLGLNDLSWEWKLSTTTHFDLTLYLYERDDSLSGVALYSTELFDRETIERLAGQFRTLLEAAVQVPDIPVQSLPILSEAERQRLLLEWNATAAAYPSEKLIHELFEDQVRRDPSAIAVARDGMSLTYRELNTRANQLARYLRAKGIGPERLVALYVERSVEMLVGLLSVLKAGGAYVPLDPMNPVERLHLVLEDAAPHAVITQESLKEFLPKNVAEVILLDRDWEQVARQRKDDLESAHLCSRNLAYVIFTSGSTGKPKGVMIEHRNVVNYAVYAIRQFDVASGGGSLLCTSISYDLVLTSLYPTLLCGRTVWLCSEQQGVPDLDKNVVRRSNLAPLKLTPSHLGMLDNSLEGGQLVGRVRVLVLGGESLQASAVDSWRRYSPETRVFNHYGPTETTVGCIVKEVSASISGAVPIGKPISNTQIYLLDHCLQLVPVGVTGEIYVGGTGVARGYLSRPGLTAERFIADVSSIGDQTRVYRTGDSGRRRSDGDIQYLGRNDNQVKIRGHRIELGEIESLLAQHERLKEVVVLAREDDPGEKRLVAYIVVDQVRADLAAEVPPEQLSQQLVPRLRSFLKERLPDYMIPSVWIVMKELPLTSNGKVDRRALPIPESRVDEVEEYIVPRTELEQALAGIWSQVLKIDRVGVRDNFFDLGGHSLLATRVITHISDLLDIEVPLRVLFERPTIEALAENILLELATGVSEEVS